MKKYILLLICLFFLIQCYTIPKGVRKNFTYCFDSKEIGLDSLININGFYYLGEDYDSISTGEVLFYKNGFVSRKRGKYWKNQKFNITSNYDSYGTFGLYKMSNDTIKIQMIHDPSTMAVYNFKRWYKIIDSNSIKLIYSGHDLNVTIEEIKNFKAKITSREYYKKRGTLFKFYPIEKKPDMNKQYILKRKWFWCNEEKQKKWKEENLAK